MELWKDKRRGGGAERRPGISEVLGMGGLGITPQNGRKNECLLSLADYLLNNNIETGALVVGLLASLLSLAFQRGAIRCENSSSLTGESFSGFFHTQRPSSERVGSIGRPWCQPDSSSVTFFLAYFHIFQNAQGMF